MLGATSRSSPKVKEADSPVGAEQVIARVRVAERDAVAVQEAEEEPEHDLPVAVALWFRGSPHRLEPLTLDVFRDQRPPRREIGVDVRYPDEGVPAHQPLDATLMLGLELVVEFLADAFPHLHAQRFGVEARGQTLTSGTSSIALRRSVSTASATPGY